MTSTAAVTASWALHIWTRMLECYMCWWLMTARCLASAVPGPQWSVLDSHGWDRSRSRVWACTFCVWSMTWSCTSRTWHFESESIWNRYTVITMITTWTKTLELISVMLSHRYFTQVHSGDSRKISSDKALSWRWRKAFFEIFSLGLEMNSSVYFEIQLCRAVNCCHTRLVWAHIQNCRTGMCGGGGGGGGDYFQTAANLMWIWKNDGVMN